MVDICLSVVPILRCQTLSRLQSGILLLPPGLELIFALVLLWVKRVSDKRDVFVASEVFVYFLLAILDVLSHNIPSLSTSFNSFRSVDIVIGVGSLFPLLFYTLALYLLTSSEFIPSLPDRFHNTAKYALFAFIPFIVILNELSSFVGITYQSVGGANGLRLFVGFTNNTARVFLNTVTLILITAFQALNFCVAFYRLVYRLTRAFSQQRKLEQNEKEMETHLFRGLGWIVVGMKLGAIETIIGFAQGGFPIALTRRLLRFLARAFLIIGLAKGVDTVEDFQLYSPTEVQKRRKSTLRAMIQNPRFSTFRHVGGHDFDKTDPFDEKRQSVIRLGDPSWMRRDYRPGLIDEERATPGLLSIGKRKSALTFLTNRPSPSRGRNTPSARNSGSSFGSTRRGDSPYIDSPSSMYDDDEENVNGIATVPRRPMPVRQRVTVHIRKDLPPVLELRRFSRLDFLDLISDPFRDPHTRSLSLPMVSRGRPEHAASTPLSAPAPLTRLRSYSDAAALRRPFAAPATPTNPVPTVQSTSVRESVGTQDSHRVSFASYDRPVAPSRAAVISHRTFGRRDSVASTQAPHEQTSDPRQSGNSRSAVADTQSSSSFAAAGSSRATIASWETPEGRYARTSGGVGMGLGIMSRRDRGLSSSTTVSEVHALALQFPGIPPRRFSTVPPRRSMLSREFVAAAPDLDADAEAAPADEPAQEQNGEDAKQEEEEVVRVPSVKRKPSPLMTEGLVDARMRGVEIEQVVDDAVAAANPAPTPVAPVAPSPPRGAYPTPMSMSAPRRYLNARPRPHSASRVADVPMTPTPLSEHGSVGYGGEDGEAVVVRSTSLVRRNVALNAGVSGEMERGKLVRVKSVGSAPRRTVSAARRVAAARDSIRVELGHVARLGKVADVVGSAGKEERGGGRGDGESEGDAVVV